jgi:hypothetical protein
MLPLARTEGEQISGAIYVYLFIFATLKRRVYPNNAKSPTKRVAGLPT